MIKNVYSLFDKKAKLFTPPFVSDNVQTARRSLMLPVNELESFLGMYPDDYEVYDLGTFDDSTGKIEPREVKDFCFNLSDLVRVKPAPGGVSAGVAEVAAKGVKTEVVKHGKGK